MSNYEVIATIISSIALIFVGLNFLYQLNQYKKQNRISTLSALLNSAQEISRRYDGNKSDENKRINDRLSVNIMKYADELMNEIEGKKQ